jgi:hypothetical protein
MTFPWALSKDGSNSFYPFCLFSFEIYWVEYQQSETRGETLGRVLKIK